MTIPTNEEIRNAGGNDLGEWGDKKLDRYPHPLVIDGEPVDLDKLPAFGSDEPGHESDEPPADEAAET